jgi:hypothetical protein
MSGSTRTFISSYKNSLSFFSITKRALLFSYSIDYLEIQEHGFADGNTAHKSYY